MSGNDQSKAANALPAWLAPAPGQKLTHMAAPGAVLVKSGAGQFISLNVNTPAAGSLTVRDGVDAGGPILAQFSTANANFLVVNWAFATGLFVTLAGAADISIAWA